MGIDEALFGWLYRAVARRVRREPAAVRARTVDAEPLLPRLRVLAGAGAGRTLDMRLVDGEGGVAGDWVLLPRKLDALATAEDNERLLLVRATLAGALVRAGVSRSWQDPAALAAALPSVVAGLSEELPGWSEQRARLPADLPLSLLVGRLYPPATSAPAPAPGDAARLPSEVTTEREAKRRGPPARRKRLLEDRRPDNPLTHSFEKVHTLEEHRGGAKRADGSDELDAHAAALEEVDLQEVVVSGEHTSSIYRAGMSYGGDELGAEGPREGLRYDEWDAKRRRYLARHCSVSVERPGVDLAAGAALRARIVSGERRALADARAELKRLDSAMRWHTRQPDGPDVDLDALVDRATSLRSGHDGPTRLYVSRRKRGHSVAILLLVDASLSTDAWVANQRVLDLERDAAAVVSLAFDDVVDELGICAFCSFSREDCRFMVLKALDEPLARGLGRLARLEPRGYTRVGPALRHASSLLRDAAARRKAILLLSDGKPTDTDRYEGRHGIGDVRQAVREAKREGIDVFALSADPRSRPMLPQMFGTRGYAGLSTPRDVAAAVGQLVSELMR